MSLLWLLVGCIPHIDPGPVPMVEAGRPVPVLEVPDATSPDIYLSALIRAGASYDPLGQEGVAWITAHALAEAGAGALTPPEVEEALYPLGTAFQVVVDEDYVSLRLTCHGEVADACIERFADALVQPHFEPEAVERIRDRALEAVGEGLLADEEALARLAFEAVLFGGTGYGHPPAGREGVLPILDAGHVRAFYEDRYRRSSVHVGIAGAYSDEQVAHLRDRLGEVPGGLLREPIRMSPPAVEGRSLLALDTDTPVTGFVLGHPLTIDRSDPDWPALLVGMTAFGAHRQSFGRLFRSLRGDRGLNYGTYAYAEPFVQRGWSMAPEQGVLRDQRYFALWVRPTALENGPFALKLAVDELERLVAEGLTDEELDDTRKHLTGAIPLLAQDPGRRMLFALDAAATGTPDPLVDLPDRVREVTAEQVRSALSRWLHPDDLVIVAVSGEAEALARDVSEEKTTPVVYRSITPDAEQARRDEQVAAKVLSPSSVRVRDAGGIFR